MVSAWWLVVAAILGFSLGFLLVSALMMLRDDEGPQSDDSPITDRTPQHT